jgi:predicted DNA-binding WGR domain protein
MNTRLELSAGTSNKFWEVSVEGASYRVTYGRLDGKGAKSEAKTFANAAEAEAAARRIVAEKLRKGYSQVAGDGFETAQTGAAKAPVGAAATPAGSVRARDVLTGKTPPVSSGVAAAALEEMRTKKHVPVATVMALLRELDQGGGARADAEAVLSAYAALFTRSDFVAKSVPSSPYDGQEPAVVAIIEVASRARALGILTSVQQQSLVGALADRTQGTSPYVFVGGLKTILKRAEREAELEPLALAFVDACVDRMIEKGKDPATFLFFQTDDEKPTFFWHQHTVDRLGAKVDATTVEGAAVARALSRLESFYWLKPGATQAYLLSSPALNTAVRGLEQIANDPARVLATAKTPLAGYTESAGRVVAVDTGKLMVGTKVLSDTGHYHARSLQLVGDRIVALTENSKQNNVAHLQVFDASGAKLGSNVLPRPVHHLVGSSSAVDADGAVLYASSDRGSQDSLARVTTKIDASGKLTVNANYVDADTTEGAKRTGFKLRAVAVHGKQAFGALHHEARNALKIVAYQLPDMKESAAILDVPAPYVGSHHDLKQIAVNDTHVFVAGEKSLMVFERHGATAKLLGALPLAVSDVRARTDGDLDVVLHDRSFDLSRTRHDEPKEWLVRLTAREVKDLLVAPFG